jgi:putative addiction module killer protein
VEIEEYLDENGDSPFNDWFQNLDLQAGARVTRSLTRIALGNLADTKSVGAGVLENRIEFGPGYRIYLGRDGDTLIVLLAGGTKRRQQADIEAARARWADYKRRKKEQTRGRTDPKLQGERESPRGARTRVPRGPSRGGRR